MLQASACALALPASGIAEEVDDGDTDMQSALYVGAIGSCVSETRSVEIHFAGKEVLERMLVAAFVLPLSCLPNFNACNMASFYPPACRVAFWERPNFALGNQ